MLFSTGVVVVVSWLCCCYCLETSREQSGWIQSGLVGKGNTAHAVARRKRNGVVFSVEKTTI